VPDLDALVDQVVVVRGREAAVDHALEVGLRGERHAGEQERGEREADDGLGHGGI
jgi:hypothetical protein